MHALERIFRSFKVAPNGCWIWMRAKDDCGYGLSFYEKRKLRAHRLLWILANKTEPAKGLCVCHKCDNPSCVNPEHLFLASYRDNAIDRDNKNRGRWSELSRYFHGHRKGGRVSWHE